MLKMNSCLISTVLILIAVRHVLSGGLGDVSNHPAWEYLDSLDCGFSATDRIVGGLTASLGQFPWLVRFGYKIESEGELDWMCGAALITDRHVLTAGHCVMPGEYVLSDVRIGEFDTRTNPDCQLSMCAPPVQDRKIKHIIIHPEFNKPPYHNDIAIVEMDNPVELNEYVTPLCLPREEEIRPKLGEIVSVAGWGKTNMTTQERAQILQYIALPIVAPDECSFGKGFKVDSNEILCAGAQLNQDTCVGDSGGPLMKVFDTEEGPKTFAIGVVSFGPTICGNKKPGVYSFVPHYLKWILDSIKEDVNATCKNFEGDTCKILYDCPYVINMITNREFEKARIRLCGFEENKPKVCCPKDVEAPKDNVIVFNNETEPSATKRPATREDTSKVPSTTLPTISLGHSDPFPNRSICGQVKNDDRIIGGQLAGIDEFPWLAQLKFVSRHKEYVGCAGSLITDRHILTAAHCVLRKVPHVRLGEYNVNTEHDCVENDCNDKPVDVAVKEAVKHPKYNDADISRYDIAILVLEQSVNFTDYIQPVCLPTTEYVAVQDYLKDSSYLTAGWGATEYDVTSPVKRKLRLNAVPIETCQVSFGNINVSLSYDNNVICAGGRKDEDSCQGDSGGSLVREVSEDYKVNWFIYGVTSFGARICGEEGLPGAYTRVTAYMDWIRETVSRT
ncbi:serine protease 7-like [Aricia agestis]|uniref:serine protease 7-like n=1 Tax=Aricia agestis TaxID=91739 RepID=UPI001C2027F4|nr:serine protease 7-like [Aricia agestis]